MSLLTPQPVVPTKDQALEVKGKYIKQVTKNAYSKLTDIQRSGIELLWNDPKFTPQELVDVLGEDAVKIFKMHSILTDAIVKIAEIDNISPMVSLPTKAFEVVDGRIVVSDAPYTP